MTRKYGQNLSPYGRGRHSDNSERGIPSDTNNRHRGFIHHRDFDSGGFVHTNGRGFDDDNDIDEHRNYNTPVARPTIPWVVKRFIERKFEEHGTGSSEGRELLDKLANNASDDTLDHIENDVRFGNEVHALWKIECYMRGDEIDTDGSTAGGYNRRDFSNASSNGSFGFSQSRHGSVREEEGHASPNSVCGSSNSGCESPAGVRKDFRGRSQEADSEYESSPGGKYKHCHPR